MAERAEMTVIFGKAPRGLMRAYRAEQQAAVKSALQYWHASILPKHFTTAGAREYGYEKRAKKYQQKKARSKHHQKPLVFSGHLLERMRERAQIRLRKANGSIKYTRTGISRMQDKAVDRIAELTTVSQQDMNDLNDVMKREFVRGVRRLQGK